AARPAARRTAPDAVRHPGPGVPEARLDAADVPRPRDLPGAGPGRGRGLLPFGVDRPRRRPGDAVLARVPAQAGRLPRARRLRRARAARAHRRPAIADPVPGLPD